MDALSSALTVLTAMITPAVLISACGTLILSTSTRLGRVVDRVRALSDNFEEMAHNSSDGELELFEDRRAVIFDQLDKLTSRARILQRSMIIFYIATGVFVSTSVAIGVSAALGGGYGWVPVAMGIVGALFLFYGSILLIFEAQLALSTLSAEMDFIWRLGKTLAPAELVNERSPHYNRLTLRRPKLERRP